MPKPRREQIALDATPFYHCVSRCVRRAFLCGTDRLTGTSYEHRRGWLEETLLFQAQVFAIDIAAYAVMSNHYHVVLHVNQQQALSFSNVEVVERWHRLYKGTSLSRRFISNPQTISDAELEQMNRLVGIWRSRLCDISWFMRRLNELIAREANKEDDCTGHFWEGRFSSQALLDDKALAACLAYVDLNPVRANMAATPEDSEYTSIYKRVRSVVDKEGRSVNGELLPFRQIRTCRDIADLPFSFEDYLMLLDWTGRGLRDKSNGVINEHAPPIVERLGFKVEQWFILAKSFESHFSAEVGAPDALSKSLGSFKKVRRHQLTSCQQLFV